MHNELLQVTTSDELILNGLYKAGDKSKPAVIHVHGFTSDFYTNNFSQHVQEALGEANIANVAIQTRGSGIRSEIMKKGREESVWLGSFYEKIEEAHLDISAWVEFLLGEGYERIVLSGHSLGTIKVVRYLFEGKYADKVDKLVLFAPFDKNGYLQDKNGDSRWKGFVEIAREKIAAGQGEEIIPPEYDDYPMSYQTFVSWYEDSELGNMWDFYRAGEYDFPTLEKIKIPVQIIVGDADDCFYLPSLSTLESAIQVLKRHIAQLDLHVLAGAGHTYVGYEDEVANLARKFVIT